MMNYSEKYCDRCDKNVKSSPTYKQEVYDVKGQSIKITSKVYICPICGNELWDDQADNANLLLAFNKYRKLNHLLMPEEIKSIRLKYGLSQSLFAKVLGLGEKTITRYENGSLQDPAQNNLIMLASSWDNFTKLLGQVEYALTEAEKQKIQEATGWKYQIKSIKKYDSNVSFVCFLGDNESELREM